ncbi:MAG: hypothetical protein IH622_14900 [Ochrobactrum anthropi]|uniref:Uncharacterized protein n=1 Tax=Brucella anthropi TaxID=529 RepID=A0A8I0N7Q1_BRUAN|nr:hypothetical protein [Brucella anthropi]MBE0562088.1 hypothetical protein [Brucella anthropi]
MPTHSSQATAEGMPKNELPVDRVDRLAKELAEALNDWMAGEFMAVILPTSRGGDFPIMFGNIKSQREAIAHQAGRAL